MASDLMCSVRDAKVARAPRVSRRTLRALAFAAGLSASFSATLVSARDASAEPTAAEKETARGQMADGRTKRQKNDLEGALRAFEAADALMHVPTTGL